ncbi:cobaltochelatase subunit CobN [Mesorhizobium sp. BR1-1-16]|uniref:cobaltochelatase subunit CobN n=1 Tax=Mesorhizobium sp. BR1-1-16 TaxID=2876653 RepID=UPI001CC94084|nr:cobaltochelatase subunit CobN [Mesorhizobium sp. BR1-1-16]MBZ9939313.1 cobaltochelatase subunit CobN [Mesorhizobium sp. BR1-1-16]
MHLVAGETERIDDGSSAVDLDQSPGDIVLISAADSELAAFAAAAGRKTAGPSIRLANLMRLGHPYSVDLYLEKTLAKAKLVVLRLIGSAGYWPYGLEALRALSRGGGPRIIVVPGGDERWDPALEAYCTVALEDCRQFWRAAVAGGPGNIDRALQLARHLVDGDERPSEAEPLPVAGLHHDGADGRPLALIVFYRALIEGGSTGPVDALIAALENEGIAARAVFVSSPKNPEAAAFITEIAEETPPDIVINGTAFALSKPGRRTEPTVLDRSGRPVLQIVFAGTTREAWQQSARGLGPRDMIMNVVLPEVDGRILTRPVSFKEELPRDGVTDSRIVAYHADRERIAFVAAQAARWVRLGRKPAAQRQIAIILSNYPGRDGRIGNGVGLDTPESTMRIASAMREAGYELPDFPQTGRALIAALEAVHAAADPSTRGPGSRGETDGITIPLAEYLAFHRALPDSLREELADRWGAPEQDPAFVDGAFRLAIRRFGNIAVGVQPARGYGVDPKATYHDPLLPPPHHYLAFYAWLRRVFDADAIVEVGKHGNLEWLPGKAIGLSADCWPEAALGPVPLIYPFIVNDPGEGAQAKRRSAAVIVDHLMPAITRAEAHGPFAELETLIDEYHLALGADPRRRDDLEREILERAARHGIDHDLEIGDGDPSKALRAIDAHLCDIKELQIRDGLHIFGESPGGKALATTVAAIARISRSGGRPADASLLRALAADLGLGDFDPLAPDHAAPWSGARPAALIAADDAVWRSAGDTAERIELLALSLVAATVNEGPPRFGAATDAVLDWIADDLAPALARCGMDETVAVMTALDGRFVAPGPAGAPSRGRPDSLPTGRNFFSVDTRAVPTEAAWRIGRRAAEALVLRYMQDEGEWPRAIALTVWGTANMRTGGDDIAQVLALIGAEPVWEAGTGRVTGFRVLTLAELKRPRVDVTLRISGMFRDAFPEQIDLIDSAIRAIAERDEPEDANPIAAARRREGDALRIFGSQPGAYGSGLQAMMDHDIWRDRADLADAFLGASGFAYGGGAEGRAAGDQFRTRLGAVDAILHNQDNREHDILDSDEYHQFQGGLALAAEAVAGRAPRLYHGDHASPDNPVVRPLSEEIGRVVRGRATNPKWVEGAMRHGYRGAFEIAATVDLLFGFAATTHAVGDHHFDALYDAYLADERVADFMADANPAALADMAARFEAAIERGLWSPLRNSTRARLAALSGQPTALSETTA